MVLPALDQVRTRPLGVVPFNRFNVELLSLDGPHRHAMGRPGETRVGHPQRHQGRRTFTSTPTTHPVGLEPGDPGLRQLCERLHVGQPSTVCPFDAMPEYGSS